MAELYNEGLFRKGLVRTSGLVRPDLLLTFDDIFSPYAIDRLEAALALDFNNNVYRTANTSTTFADAFTGTSPKLTYSTSSNSTMVNSAGNIVWAPHNLLANSEHFTTWFASGGATVGSPTLPDPTGSNSASQIVLNSAADFVQLAVSGLSTTAETHFRAWVKGTGTVRLGNVDAGSYDEITLTSEWQLVGVTQTPSAATRFPRFLAPASGGVTFEVFGAHLYRSDLGGMAQVPGAATGFETYVPTNGNPEYLPRVGHHVYNGSTWVNEGLLIESEPRTNLVTHSDFSGGSVIPAGIKSGGFVPNSASGPDGATSATVLIEDTSTGAHRLNVGGFSITSGVVYTASVYVKPNGRNEVRLIENATTGAYASFNVETGAIVSSGSGGSGLIENAGGGWYRCAMTFTSAGTGGRIDVYIQSSGSISYTGDDTSGLYLYGLQLDQGQVVNGTPVDAPTPSSYMPTYGNQFTRTAQSLTVPAHWYNADNPTYTGPELVTNGGFSNGTTGWAGSNATLSLSSGRLRVTDNGSSAYAYQVLTVEPGKTYKLTFDYLFPSANTATDYEVNIRNTNQSGSILKGLNTGTTTWVEDVLSSNSMTFTPTTSTVGLTLASSSTTGDYADFDNISVRQVSAPQFGWPEPEFIGPNLVDNSEFDTDLTGWDTTTGYSQSAGKAVADGVTIAPQLLQTIGIEANSYYQVTVDVSGWTLGSCYVVLGGVQPVNNNLNSNGSYTFYVKPTAGDYISFTTPSGTYDGQLDNISVREINPLSVSIQMDGRMTYADEGGYSTVVGTRWREDADNYITSLDLSTNSLDEGRVFVTQEAAAVYDAVSQASPGSYSPGVLVPFNIASRHGSTFVNGAVDGVALTANTTPVALPDLSGTNLQIAYDFMGTIGQFRQFAGDIGDTGLVTATKPSTEPTLSLTFDGTNGSFYNLSWSE